MSTRTRPETRGRLSERHRAMPTLRLPPAVAAARWALFPLAVFAVTRVVGWVLLSLGARDQGVVPTDTGYHVFLPPTASPGYWDVIANWDGQWYAQIAQQGYPRVLPTVSGEVVQSAWGFYPGYPVVVRGVMTLTGLDFSLAASLVSLVCGAAAVCLLYRMLLRTASDFSAKASVLCLCGFMTAPVMQVAYSESLALLLVLTCLDALRRQSWTVLLAASVALALTRPIVPAVAAVVCLHTLVTFRRSDRSRASRSRLTRGLLAGIACGATAAIWPVLAGVVTGEPRAYIRTMHAWGVYAETPMGGWVKWLSSIDAGGFIVVVAVLVTILAIVLRPGARAWGTELRLWAAVYPIYMLSVTAPGPSVLRYMLLTIVPLWPLPDPRPGPRDQPAHLDHADQPDGPEQPAPSSSRRLDLVVLVALLAIGLFAQYKWVTGTFTIAGLPTEQPFP